MKTLVLARHAKSSWDHPGMSDFQRPLNQRGLGDAPIMAERLRLSTIELQRVISSDAVRALETAEAYASVMTPGRAVRTEHVLYLATGHEILKFLQSLPEQEDSVMIVGHNPGMSEALGQLAGSFYDMPTCSYGVLQFDTEHWQSISSTTGRLLAYDFPARTS